MTADNSHSGSVIINEEKEKISGGWCLTDLAHTQRLYWRHRPGIFVAISELISVLDDDNINGFFTIWTLRCLFPRMPT